MDKSNHSGSDLGDEAVKGMIYKAAGLEAQEVTPDELRAINAYTLSPLASEDVYTFKAVLCDNELDRQYEHFTPKALHEMAKLYVGRTVIKDHYASADNQIARIYSAEVVDTGKTKKDGEPYLQLVAKAYMIRTESNADLIREISGGIKKEGSVGFRPSVCTCSICGTNNATTYCRHWPGHTYDKEGGPTVCTFKLDGVSDAYEFSLVAVPAQRRAGACKSYTGETIYEADELPETSKAPEAPDDRETVKTIINRARLAEALAKIKH